jgi:dynein heavy chain
MIKIESESRDANEKQKEVETRSAQVDKEKAEIEVLASDAQADLEKAEPALRAAENGLLNLTKNQLAEVRAYGKPPAGVEEVLQAVMILLGKDPSWASAKKEMTDPRFL